MDLAQSTILVVDDTEFNRTLLCLMLREGGFRHVLNASNGTQALDIADRESPDLIILDIMMPGMDGYEVLRRLRANPITADIPVLVQTALTSSDDRNKAFIAGTTDLVSKPIDRAELLARVRIHIENRLLLRDLQAFHDRVESEIAMARAMFSHLLPSPDALVRLTRSHHLHLYGQTWLSPLLGGDLWGFWPLPDARLVVWMLDIAGRGVTTALNAFRMHALMQDLAEHAEDPVHFLTIFAERCSGLLPLDGLATLLIGIVDAIGQNFTYASAASTTPLLLTAMPQAGDAVYAGTAGGYPLGFDTRQEFVAHRLPFPPGSALLLTSSTAITAFGEHPECVREAISAQETVNETTFQQLVTSLTAIIGETPEDDHTLVWIAHASPS